jgi:hypothetical protein
MRLLYGPVQPETISDGRMGVTETCAIRALEPHARCAARGRRTAACGPPVQNAVRSSRERAGTEAWHGGPLYGVRGKLRGFCQSDKRTFLPDLGRCACGQDGRGYGAGDGGVNFASSPRLRSCEFLSAALMAL